MPGPGLFQWSTGGWFGTQIGSTLWLPLSAWHLGPLDASLAGFLAGLFLCVNLIGTLLWLRRDRIAPYGALQLLIAVVGLVFLSALVAMDASGRLGDFEPRLREHPGVMYGGVAMFPAMMLLFHLRERGALRGRRDRPGRA
jgi:hypothetical protein